MSLGWVMFTLAWVALLCNLLFVAALCLASAKHERRARLAHQRREERR